MKGEGGIVRKANTGVRRHRTRATVSEECWLSKGGRKRCNPGVTMLGQRVDTREAWEAWFMEQADREDILKETCRSTRRCNKAERWNLDMLLGILGNLWSLQDGRVELDHSTAAPARYIPSLNPKVEAGPTTTKSRNEENGRRIHITKWMVSEFRVAMVLQGGA